MDDKCDNDHWNNDDINIGNEQYTKSTSKKDFNKIQNGKVEIWEDIEWDPYAPSTNRNVFKENVKCLANESSVPSNSEILFQLLDQFSKKRIEIVYVTVNPSENGSVYVNSS